MATKKEAKYKNYKVSKPAMAKPALLVSSSTSTSGGPTGVVDIQIVPNEGKPDTYGACIITFAFNHCNKTSQVDIEYHGRYKGSTDVNIITTNTEKYDKLSNGIGYWVIDYDLDSQYEEFYITIQCSTTYEWKEPNDKKTELITKTKTVKSKKKKSGWARPSKNFQINGSTTDVEGGEEEVVTKPDIPSSPRASMSGLKLTSYVDYYDELATHIRFRFVVNDTTYLPVIDVPIVANNATTSIDVAVGSSYKVQCAAINNNVSPPDMSSYSAFTDAGKTIPAAVGEDSITIQAISPTACYLEWAATPAAESYTIQYSRYNTEWGNSSLVSEATATDGQTHITIEDIQAEEHHEWFFRIRANNSVGSSTWTASKSIILGNKPQPPTTWQERTMISNNDINRIYWTHNCEDGSVAKKSIIKIEINQPNNGSETYEVEVGNDQESSVNYYDLNMIRVWYDSPDEEYFLEDGTSILWSVRTLGVLPEFDGSGNLNEDGWSEFSGVNKISVYEPPIVTLGFFKSNNWWWDPFNFNEDTIYTALGDLSDPYVDDPIVLTTYPINLSITVAPRTQTPIVGTLVIESRSNYETIDYFGDTVEIQNGDIIYEREMSFTPGIFRNPSRFIKQTKTSTGTVYDLNNMIVMLLPTDISLENYQKYRFRVDISTDRNLSASTYVDVETSFEEADFGIECDIQFNEEDATALLHPYCRITDDETGEYVGDLIPGINISIFRRNFDGTYDTIATNISNTSNAYVLDEHPALDYGRYRFIANDMVHYNMIVFDAEMLDFNQHYIIIQWDDQYKEFNQTGTFTNSTAEYRGSYLKLPWNIDTFESSDVDVEMAGYIGRSHPVSYYGTQVGQTASWSSDIPYDDRETIFALRRLSIWTGNCYVREPNGVGYLAQVKVSFNITHRQVLIPVTLDITRVEEE